MDCRKRGFRAAHWIEVRGGIGGVRVEAAHHNGLALRYVDDPHGARNARGLWPVALIIRRADSTPRRIAIAADDHGFGPCSIVESGCIPAADLALGAAPCGV